LGSGSPGIESALGNSKKEADTLNQNNPDEDMVRLSTELKLYIENVTFIDGNHWVKLGPEYQQGTEYNNIIRKAREILITKDVQPVLGGFIVSFVKSEENHESEYSLHQSEIGLGVLYPILKNSKGDIIDGFHRKATDPNWPEMILPQIDNNRKLHLARIAANFDRRHVPVYELKKSLTYLMTEEKLTPIEIAQGSGISLQTIYRYMPQELKNQARVLAGKASGESRAAKTILFPSENKNQVSAEQKTTEEITAKSELPQKSKEQIAAERVAAIAAKDEKFERKTERQVEKVVEAGSDYPEKLMKAVNAHLSLSAKDCKVDPEKAKEYVKALITVIIENLSEEELEHSFAQVDQI